MSVINFNPLPTRTNANEGSARGYADLGQAEFLKLMTEQIKHQDPFEPLGNEDMIAQMAQFSSLSSATEMSETLKEMSSKLDQLIAAQKAANSDSSTSGSASEPVVLP